MGKKKKTGTTVALNQQEGPAVDLESGKVENSNEAPPMPESEQAATEEEGKAESSHSLKTVENQKPDGSAEGLEVNAISEVQSKQQTEIVNTEFEEQILEPTDDKIPTTATKQTEKDKKSKKKSKTSTKAKTTRSKENIESDDQNVQDVNDEIEEVDENKISQVKKKKKVKNQETSKQLAHSDKESMEESSVENVQKQSSKTKRPTRIKTSESLERVNQSWKDIPDGKVHESRNGTEEKLNFSEEAVGQTKVKKHRVKKDKHVRLEKQNSGEIDGDNVDEQDKSETGKKKKRIEGKDTSGAREKSQDRKKVKKHGKVTPKVEEQSDIAIIFNKESPSLSKFKSDVAFEVERENSSMTKIDEAAAKVISSKKAKHRSSSKRIGSSSKTHNKAPRSRSDISLEDEYSYGSSASEIEIGSDIYKVKKRKREKKTAKGKKKSTATAIPSVPSQSLPSEQDTSAYESSRTDEEIKTSPEKRKGKKAGKKHKKKVEIQEPPKEEEKKDDVLAEIMKMKAAAAGEEVEEQVKEEEKEVKKAKKPPKKKSKKERARLTAEMSEKLKQEQEQEAARQAELERIRLEEEKKAAIEKDKRQVVEQQIRIEQLEKSDREMQEIIDHNMEIAKKEMEELEWQLYLACGKLPNPSLCDQMNTYLHLWEKVLDLTSMDEASKRTSDVVKLLSDIEDLLDTSSPPTTSEELRRIENLKWVRQLFRDHQANSLDVATYRLLRCVENNLRRIDIPTADFNFANYQIKLSIWLRVQLPIPLPNPRRPPKPRLDVTFENVNMQVLFPVVIDGENMAIRAMYLSYDHLSDLCPLYYMPHIEEAIDEDLLISTKKDWRVRMLYKYNNRDKPKSIVPEQPTETVSSPDTIASEKKEEPEEEGFASDEEIPLVPFKKLQPTASEFVAIQEEKIHQELKQQLITNVDENIINLRKYTILGGVYHLDLLYQPPQPQDFITMNMNITALYLPKQLERVPFSVIYVPPKPPEPGVRRLPEEIEEEMKKQEEEMDKLALITLTWPQHVIFLELPIVCQWDEENEHWTKQNVHDLKHNEEKGMLTFRTGVFGIFALSTLKYANLPYQAWELKPEADGTITLQITAAVLMLEFNVKEGLICISQLQNSPNNALQNMVGVYEKLYKLKRIMKEAGVDVFPEKDAFSYLDGSCEKHWPTEKHLYFDMAKLCNSFNFAWSRWNMAAGRRNIVLQMREYFPSKPKQKNHSMLLVTPLKASFVECTEVSQVFNGESIDSVKFSSDLHNLMKVTSGIAVRKNVQMVSKEVVYALADLLISTRVLSFS